MFSKSSSRVAGVVLVALALIVAGATLARNLNPAGASDDRIRPMSRVSQARHTLDEDYTQLRYIKTTDYGATWTPLTIAGDLSTFAPTTTKLPEFSAVTTATNELCYAVILPTAAAPGVYSMTGPTFTPVLVMARGSNTFDVGYESVGGRTDIGRCPNGDLIMIIWGHNASGQNTLWAAKSTDNGASWGTPWVAANESMLGAYDAANYTHMFHISDRNSNTTAFALYQRQGADGWDQYVLRIPTAGGLGTVTAIGDYSGHPFSYMFSAAKPIAYDPTANWLYICFHNHDRSGSLVYASNNGGATFSFQVNTGNPGPRYPAIALRPEGTTGTPFLIWNMTISMPVGQRACVWYSYDEFGYNGGFWTDPDSLVCVTRDDFSSTGGVCYVNEAYFWDATHGIGTHNSWDEPATGEKLYTTRTTDGGESWGEFTLHWHYLNDTLDAATMHNAEVVGGSNGVAYAITCAKRGLTDLEVPVVSGMELLSDYHSTGPYAVKAFYEDNLGMDTTRAWVNWSDPQVLGGQEIYDVRDSAQLTDVVKQTGWYFFTIPDTNAAGGHWANGDTIDFYCDGYDVSGLYGSVDYDHYIIVGQAYLGVSEPGRPVAAEEFRLVGNYPNPFNPVTRIEFSLPADLRVTLKVFNTLGQEVAVLADGRMFAKGLHAATFNASGLSSGVYFYTLQAGPYSAVSKMVLMK
jgi:hypothetical protein